MRPNTQRQHTARSVLFCCWCCWSLCCQGYCCRRRCDVSGDGCHAASVVPMGHSEVHTATNSCKKCKRLGPISSSHCNLEVVTAFERSRCTRAVHRDLCAQESRYNEMVQAAQDEYTPRLVCSKAVTCLNSLLLRHFGPKGTQRFSEASPSSGLNLQHEGLASVRTRQA